MDKALVAIKIEFFMAKKDGKTAHVSETPATQMLKAHKVEFTGHPYE